MSTHRICSENVNFLFSLFALRSSRIGRLAIVFCCAQTYDEAWCSQLSVACAVHPKDDPSINGVVVTTGFITSVSPSIDFPVDDDNNNGHCSIDYTYYVCVFFCVLSFRYGRFIPLLSHSSHEVFLLLLRLRCVRMSRRDTLLNAFDFSLLLLLLQYIM